MTRLYRYVGPEAIARRAAGSPGGAIISSPDDVLRWVIDTGQRTGRLVATFVIDELGRLRIADRHSEHVACAAGRPVQAAGEMTFILTNTVEVASVSNQSTGYCPEPESWPAVVRALNLARLQAPDGYSLSLIYRRCVACDSLNIVKDDDFACVVCEAELPAAWNLADA